MRLHDAADPGRPGHQVLDTRRGSGFDRRIFFVAKQPLRITVFVRTVVRNSGKKTQKCEILIMTVNVGFYNAREEG